MKREKKNELDEFILKSMESCPYGANSDSCMFSVLRSYSEREKKRWFDQLSLSDKKQIYTAHKRCNLVKKNHSPELKCSIDYISVNQIR